MATPAGIEGPPNRRETPPEAAKRSEEAPTPEAAHDVSRGQGTDPDDALKLAIKAAVDAGQYDRAAKLLDVLRATPSVAAVLDLAKRR